MKKILKESLFFWLVALGGLVFGGYCLVLWAENKNPFLNFGVVENTRIYRSAQPAPSDLEKMHKEYGIKTIICLNGREEERIKEKAQKLGINLVEFRLQASRIPSLEAVKLISQILSGKDASLLKKKPRELKSEPEDLKGFLAPYLIHCQMGADRTGYIVALYRICFQGWEVERARREMLRYFHLPAKYPRLWESLNQLEPGEFCPKINSQYQG